MSEETTNRTPESALSDEQLDDVSGGGFIEGFGKGPSAVAHSTAGLVSTVVTSVGQGLSNAVQSGGAKS